VVVNASGSIRSDAVPLPWGGDGPSVTLSPGLNAFVIPREQFLDSPFGAAMFLGRNTSYNTSNGAPPLVGSSEASYLTPFGGANLMVDLGAYRQNRATELTGAGADEGTGEFARTCPPAVLRWSGYDDFRRGRDVGHSAPPCAHRQGAGRPRSSDLHERLARSEA